MSCDGLVVGKKYHPISIGRDVRKPVVELIRSNLLLLASVGPHAPDLHAAGPFGIEVDVLAVRRILGAIVQTLRRGQARFFGSGASGSSYRVDIEVAISLADKS